MRGWLGDPGGNGWKQIEWLICIAASVALCISRRQVYLFSTEILLLSTPPAASESHPSPHLNTQWNHPPASPGINNSTLVAGWARSDTEGGTRSQPKKEMGWRASTAERLGVDWVTICCRTASDERWREEQTLWKWPRWDWILRIFSYKITYALSLCAKSQSLIW